MGTADAPRSIVLSCALLLLALPTPLALACSEPHRPKPPALPSKALLGPAPPQANGAWFDPARSGEGVAVQVLEDGRAIAAWFTYPPASEPGEQAWLLATEGTFDGATLRFPAVFRPQGARFGAAFDPAQVANQPWGTLSLELRDCTAAVLRWSGPAAWGSGERVLTKATTPDQVDCRASRALTPSGARAQAGLRSRSGSWFAPGRGGEGWLVEDLDGGLSVLTWFTYTPDGRQAWFTGAGVRSGDQLVVQPIQTRGTRFGAGFDAAAVENLPWGRITVDFGSCGAARLAYESTREGYGAATRDIVRLAGTAGTTCVDDFGERTRGTWREHAPMPPPAQSELAATVLDGRIHVLGGFGDLRGFKRYDPATDAWTRLADLPAGRHHGAAFAFEGAVYFSGGELVSGDQVNGGFRYDVAAASWRALPQLAFNFGSHAAVLHGRAYIGNEDGSLQVYDLRSGATGRVEPASARQRDHSQVLAWHDEIWMIAGRSPETTSVAIYDPVLARWRAGPPLNRARGGFAAAVVGGQLVVAGGELLAGGTRLERSVEVLAPGADAWRFAPEMPVALHGVGGAAAMGRFWLLGGSTLAGSPAGQSARTWSLELQP
jgi:N-acetylneuraminic acid mutarotase